MNKLYRVKWGELEEFTVERETVKTVIAVSRSLGGNYTVTIRRNVIGTEYHETAKAAWSAEAQRLASEITRTKDTLENLRAAVMVAQGEAKK